MAFRTLGAFAAAALVGLAPAAVQAQHLGGQRFSPAASEDGVFETEGADRRPLYLPYVGLWFHYALSPVLVVDDDGNEVAEPVRHVVAADLAVAVTVWEGLELGAQLPLTLYSWSGDEAAVANLDAPGFALGDLIVRVGYRQRLRDSTALALHVPVLLPTSGDDNVLGLGWGVKPTIALMQRFERVELYVNLSALFRGSADAIDFHGGHELGVRAALRIALTSSWATSALVDIGFSTPFVDFFSAASTPAEGRAGVEHWFGEHWRLSGFVGTGLSPGVGSPDLRVGVGVAFGENPSYRPRPNPTSHDRDGDGILDADDECPRDPEDPDGFQDEDGCPDDDNDRDGVMDRDDGCPIAPETRNGISDRDGCPDLVRVEDTLITTFEPVHFRTGSDEILSDSFPMLEEVAAVLAVNPGMRIRIEGHTDSVGDDQENLDLSTRRAQSVRRFLIEHDVDGGQVVAEGFGEQQPILSNETAEGRAQNRRVEFHILSEED
jgi:outer membrane protein OmpA-like peptidoglycan-associated protein